MKSDIQKAVDKLKESMEAMAKDAGGWKVSDIAAVKGLTKEIVSLKQQLATAKQEAKAYQISLENLEASLPKVRANAVREAVSIVSSGAIEINHKFMIIEQPYCYISTRALREYADKLEAGNEKP